MIKQVIAWDLGGTKCTAGIVEYNEKSQFFNCRKKITVKIAETTSLENLIHRLEEGLEFSMNQADAICIAGAGCYDGQFLISAGSYPYSMPFAQLAKYYHWPNFSVIHDYAAIICATFTSYMQDKNNVKRLNDCEINPFGRRVAFGLGTGLGLKDGVLFPNGQFWLGKNEIGHIGIISPPFADSTHLQYHQEFMQFLRNKNENTVTFESILTGRGVLNLYQFFYPHSDEKTPEEVGKKIQAGQASLVLAALAWYLGLFVGTVELIFMPEGGLWITGGVTLANLNIFDQPEFEKGILCSPAYLEERAHYPLGILCNKDHALIGCAYYAINITMQP